MHDSAHIRSDMRHTVLPSSPKSALLARETAPQRLEQSRWVPLTSPFGPLAGGSVLKWRRNPVTGRPLPIRRRSTFHSRGRPGKLEVIATKPMATQRDLSLAYSPGVAVPVLAIAADESKAYDYTVKGNLVAVITNGTAILGLGDLGALASKPVMEGKAVLFKRFADVDSIDLEVSSEGPRRDHQLRQAPRQRLGRHQPRGHQGPGVLHHRAAAARAARHPGVPRRPARHRDHRRRRPDQRAAISPAARSKTSSSSATAPAPPASPAWS